MHGSNSITRSVRARSEESVSEYLYSLPTQLSPLCGSYRAEYSRKPYPSLSECLGIWCFGFHSIIRLLIGLVSIVPQQQSTLGG